MQGEELVSGSEVAAADEARLAEVHPELRPAALIAPNFALSDQLLQLTRDALLERRNERPVEDDPEIACEEVTIPGREGRPAVRALIYRRVDHPPSAPAILSLHGGGFLLGTPEAFERASLDWVHGTGCTVIAIDYRLAPEHPYPAALEDAWTALLWAADASQGHSWDTGRIVLKGDSAGGGLAAGLALYARDRGGPPVAGQVLIYPMLDDRTRAEPHRTGANTLVWPCESNQFAWASYLGSRNGEVEPYAAPARATDLRGLPPTFIGTGSIDLFYREDVDFAKRLAEAGIPVASYVVQGAYHGFDALAPETGPSRRFLKAAQAAMAFLLACGPEDT